MKYSSVFTFLAFAALGSSLQAVSTDPMGGMIIPIKGASDTRISLPFSRAISFEGRIESISTNTITVAGTPGWADGQFVYGDADSADPANTYYLIFMSGVNEGLALEITANTADTVTLALGGESLSGVSTDAVDGDGNGDIFQIIPYWTPDTLFADTAIPDQTIIYRYLNSGTEINRSAAEVLTYFQDYGWYDSGGSISDDDPLNVAEGIIIRTPSATSDFDVTIAGAVPMYKARFVFATDGSGNPNDIIFSILSPVDVSVGASGLGNVADQTILYAYDNTDVDTNKSASAVLTYFYGYGWYDSGGNLVDDTFMLEPGQNYVLRKPGTETPDEFVWSYLPSYLE